MTAIFDTHAHYDDDAFNDDREQLLAALPGQGIARVVDVGASLASCRKVLELMEQYDLQTAFACCALSPWRRALQTR